MSLGGGLHFCSIRTHASIMACVLPAVCSVWSLVVALGWMLVADGQKLNIHGGGASIKPTATRGMVIDAGSGGSRLHVYQWKPRIFGSVPPPLSYPEANEHWTARMDPGIHTLADNLAAVEQHLAPLIDFAKVTLVGNEAQFGDYPIYFKATGGMRELPVEKREAILAQVQKYLSDKSFCPFYFRNDFARVISGEEEAIFSWAATNFLKGTLLPASHGIGEVKGVNHTYGTLDLGGASTQIAFYQPSQDILEGLFRLQIGGQKEWNVYAKSFLQFGMASARIRHLQATAEAYALASKPPASSTFSVEAICLHAGYTEPLSDDPTSPHVTPGLTIYNIRNIIMKGPSSPIANQFQQCKAALRPLLEKKAGAFCNEVYHGDCSIAGAYQPPLPHSLSPPGSSADASAFAATHGNFLGTSTYKYAWTFLQLPDTASIEQFDAKGAAICEKTYSDVVTYYTTNNLNTDNDKMTDIIPYSCFIAAYISVLLQDGYGFYRNDTLTVLDTINGNKVGWALGAILYEINELPWVLRLGALETHPFSFVLLAAVTGFFLGIAATVVVYREVLADKFHHISAAWQAGNSPSAKAHYLYHRYHQVSQELDDDASEDPDGAHAAAAAAEEGHEHSSGGLLESFGSVLGFGGGSSTSDRPPSSKGSSRKHPSPAKPPLRSSGGSSQSNLMSFYKEYEAKKSLGAHDFDMVMLRSHLPHPHAASPAPAPDAEARGPPPPAPSSSPSLLVRMGLVQLSEPLKDEASSSRKALSRSGSSTALYSVFAPTNRPGWLNWVDMSTTTATTASSSTAGPAGTRGTLGSGSSDDDMDSMPAVHTFGRDESNSKPKTKSKRSAKPK